MFYTNHKFTMLAGIHEVYESTNCQNVKIIGTKITRKYLF